MHFLKTLVLFTGTVSALAVSNERRASSITTTLLDQITTLDTSVLTLSSAIGKLNIGLGTLLQALNINNQFTIVHNNNRAAYNTAAAITSPFSEADAVALISLVQNTLVIDNPKAAALVKQKKPVFDLLFQSKTVLNDLNTLLADHLSLSAALIKWTPASQIDKANAAVDSITAALQDAIKYYS